MIPSPGGGSNPDRIGSSSSITSGNRAVFNTASGSEKSRLKKKSLSGFPDLSSDSNNYGVLEETMAMSTQMERLKKY
jgi:hypothetical protein